jgi:hypothetical protein
MDIKTKSIKPWDDIIFKFALPIYIFLFLRIGIDLTLLQNSYQPM